MTIPIVRISTIALIFIHLTACEGTGSSGGSLRVDASQVDASCALVPGTFPSGLGLVPGSSDLVAAASASMQNGVHAGSSV